MATLDQAVLAEIIGGFGHDPGKLLPVLEAIQQRCGSISEAAMETVADALNLPLSKVYGVASFYSLLSTEVKGTHVIRLCESAPCHLAGKDAILESLRQTLGVKPGETTKDGLFTLEYTSCLGVCGEGPAMMVDEVLFTGLTPDKAAQIVADYRQAAKGGTRS